MLTTIFLVRTVPSLLMKTVQYFYKHLLTWILDTVDLQTFKTRALTSNHYFYLKATVIIFCILLYSYYILLQQNTLKWITMRCLHSLHVIANLCAIASITGSYVTQNICSSISFLFSIETLCDRPLASKLLHS